MWKVKIKTNIDHDEINKNEWKTVSKREKQTNEFNKENQKQKGC